MELLGYNACGSLDSMNIQSYLIPIESIRMAYDLMLRSNLMGIVTEPNL